MGKGDVRYLDVMMAGLGGQGVITIGRLLAEAGMKVYSNVLCFPKYGAAMRGGESECTVIFSEEEIPSPAVYRPQAAIIMTTGTVLAPILKEFESRVKPGGTIILDSSIVQDRIQRDDVKVFYIPASSAAHKLGSRQVANFILLGAYLEASKAVPIEVVEKTLGKTMAGSRRRSLLPLNKKALRKGAELMANYKG